MCKTQSAAILPIKLEFYGPDDLIAVSEVQIYFVQVWYLPRRDCPAATIWNHWELDVQNTMYGHFAYKTRILWVIMT